MNGAENRRWINNSTHNGCKVSEKNEKRFRFPQIICTFAAMKQYKDIFLDFDDTLYDTHGNAVIALRELFDDLQLGRWFADEQVFYDAYWQANIDLWTRYSKGEITRDYLIVVEGARELMDHLKTKGYGLHMCSNGFHEVQYKKLKACGLHDYFDTIVLSEDAGANKPSAQFFDYAMQQSKAEKKLTLMVGDNFQTDILGAKRYGLDVAYFNRYPEYPAEEPVTFEVSRLSALMDIL